MDCINNASYRDLIPLYNYLNSNSCSEEVQVYAIEDINFFSDPILNSNDTVSNYTQKILKMTTHLKQFGNPEDEFFAEYIENLIPDFNSMTVGDVYDIYNMTKTQTHELTKQYLLSIVVPFAEAAYPFIVYALTEATLGAALPILTKIPSLPALNSAWINNIVRQIGILGTRGTTNSVRIVTTNGNAYSKSLELFKSITKNANSI